MHNLRHTIDSNEGPGLVMAVFGSQYRDYRSAEWLHSIVCIDARRQGKR